jgi:hypothetical protein
VSVQLYAVTWIQISVTVVLVISVHEGREKLPMNAVILRGYGKNICFFTDVGSVQLCLI